MLRSLSSPPMATFIRKKCESRSFSGGLFYRVVTSGLWNIPVSKVEMNHGTRKMLRMQTGRFG
jgi:hypothetical protein